MKEERKEEEKEVNVLVLAWRECEESVCMEQEETRGNCVCNVDK